MEDIYTRLIEHLRKECVTGIFIKRPSSIRYLTGFTGEDSLLYIDGKRMVIITDSRFAEQAEQEAPQCYVIIHQEGLWKAAGTLGISGAVGLEGSSFTYDEYVSMAQELKDASWKSVDLSFLREVKDAGEIGCIQKAVAISDEAFRMLLPQIHVGMAEVELAAMLEYNMRRLGSEETAFKTIVASGARSALPHATASNKLLEKGDFVVFDFGATYMGYRSDITRTVVVGEPNRWQRELYDLVLVANQLGIDNVKPGVLAKDVDAIVRAYFTRKEYGEYFLHGLGHGVGLEIHEEPYLNKRGDKALCVGHVVTVEPGLYIPSTGGVRIEDTVVVTERGCQVLTTVSKQLLVVN